MLFIEPGSPWENGYNESYNGKLRHEVLNREVFYNLKEAKVIIERWRHEYNTVRPHNSLGYRPPAPEAIMPLLFDPFLVIVFKGKYCTSSNLKGGTKSGGRSIVSRLITHRAEK